MSNIDNGFIKVKPTDICPTYRPGHPESSKEWMAAHNYVDYHRLLPDHYQTAYEMPREAKDWADAIAGGGPVNNLVLTGNAGTGKTHGGSAASVYLAAVWTSCDRSLPICFISAMKLLRVMKDFSDKKTRAEIEHEITSAAVLVLDDIRTMTEYDIDTVAILLDERMQSNRPTIVTTNLVGREAIRDACGETLASRMLNGVGVPTGGDDRRRPVQVPEKMKQRVSDDEARRAIKTEAECWLKMTNYQRDLYGARLYWVEWLNMHEHSPDHVSHSKPFNMELALAQTEWSEEELRHHASLDRRGIFFEPVPEIFAAMEVR